MNTSASERKNFTQELEQLEKENERWKAKILSSISHEFKTPLATIKLVVRHLLRYREKMTDDAVDEKLETVLRQVENLVYSVNNLPSLEANISMIKLSKHAVDLVPFFKKLKEDAERKFGNSHSIILDFDLAKKEIEADEGLLKNIFFNLLANAMKFSRCNLNVWLGVKTTGGDMKVEIKDEGIGIEENELPKIFDSLYRGSNVKGIEGMGLGLSIVKKALQMLGGRIEATSRLGHGSTFLVTIPYRS